MTDRTLLWVRRFAQKQQECGIAAVSSVANYYDTDITYSQVRKLVADDLKVHGMYVPEQALLLNQLGYAKITIVTNDLEMFDYSWNRLSKERLLVRLRKVKQFFYRRMNYDYSTLAGYYIDFLSKKDYDNQIKIDHDFAKYIKRHLRNGKPVLSMVNWNAMHRCAKSRTRSCVGEADYHAVVIRGYDAQNVFVVDSDNLKTRNGYYKLPWQRFLTITCSLILVG